MDDVTRSRAAALPPDVRGRYPFAGNTLGVPPAADGDEAPGAAVRMHYLDEGEGPAVLLLHGNPTWSFAFRRLIPALVSAGLRCVAPDHVGCGLSDKPARHRYTLEGRIDDVERLVDHLGIERFSLVVHDWGGPIGFGFAARRPESVDRIVAMNTAAFPSKRIPWRIAALKLPRIGPFVIRGLNGFVRPALTMAVTRPLPPAVRRGFLWPYRRWADRVAVDRFVRDIPLSPKHPSYAALRAVGENLERFRDRPMLLAWGERDFCFDRGYLRRWQKLFPEARVAALGDCGHYVLEDGADRLVPRIARFLAP